MYQVPTRREQSFLAGPSEAGRGFWNRGGWPCGSRCRIAGSAFSTAGNDSRRNSHGGGGGGAFCRTVVVGIRRRGTRCRTGGGAARLMQQPGLVNKWRKWHTTAGTCCRGHGGHGGHGGRRGAAGILLPPRVGRYPVRIFTAPVLPAAPLRPATRRAGLLGSAFPRCPAGRARGPPVAVAVVVVVPATRPPRPATRQAVRRDIGGTPADTGTLRRPLQRWKSSLERRGGGSLLKFVLQLDMRRHCLHLDM